LKDGSFPVYLRPFVKKALVKMKSIRDRALKNLKDMKTSEDVEAKEGSEEIQQVEEVKRVEEAKGVTTKLGAETGKKPSEQSNSESMHSSDFMKSLKQGKANHSDILVHSFVRSHVLEEYWEFHYFCDFSLDLRSNFE